ncbi:MAG: hypothetical protein Q4A07_07210 [Coriobacteriales bacterium]|nr:hypothetical protein [Coriobacteriales bacterium]
MAISNDVLAQDAKEILHGHRNVSFLIEAMVVLALFMACMSVFVQILSGAQLQGRSASITSEAVLAATNRAEEFCANPTAADGVTQEGDLAVSCVVDSVPHKAGTLYSATITVLHDNQEVYTLHTARYVHNAGGDAA